jgi:cytochrome c oxidase assembly protein subunit 11
MTPQTKTALQGLGVVLFMGSMSFAAVPFYDWFCRVTGFGGTTGVSEAPPDQILDRTIRVRFMAATERDMPWEFRPVENEMTVRIGELNLAFYEAYNPTDRPVAGQASYNIAPLTAGGYVSKIECFCFTEQVLQPGERVVMPMTFYVDPAIVDNPEAVHLREITLGYTFFEIEPSEATVAALDAAPGATAAMP